MDPLTAIGLVSNILSFISFGADLLKGAAEVYNSSSGTLENNRSREVVMRQMREFSSKLLAPDDSNFVGGDKQLCILAEECRTLSNDLIDLLNKIKVKDPKSKRQSVWSSVKNKYYEKEKENLEQRLNDCRRQLELQLTFMTSQETKASLRDLISSSETERVKLDRLQSSMDQIRQDVETASLSTLARSQIQQLAIVHEEVMVTVAQQRILSSLKFEGLHGRFDMVDESHADTFDWIFGKQKPSNTSGVQSESGDSEEDSKSYASSVGVDEDASQNSDIQTTGDSHFVEDNSDTSTDEVVMEDQTGSIRQPKDDEINKELTEEDSNTSESEEGILQAERRRGPEIEDEAKKEACDKLTSWLASGEGLFHISGKLGSGKSTLMKYLCTHDTTQEKLRKWAGQRSLVFADFFFWKPGNTLQKSLLGLYRGLLHDVLQSCPELIAEVFPTIWPRVIATPWQVNNGIDLSDREIYMAFTRLVKYRSLRESHCFCFFIDGLDEFEETAQCDHRAMVELLQSWTEAVPGAIKLCVSSREYNVFMNTLPSSTRIRLHELTRLDMATFAGDKLCHIPGLGNRRKLVKTIVEKAQGIFLWVALVTKSMRKELENGATATELMHEIDSLPDELDGLYEHIFSKMSRTTRKRAYQTLRMLAITKSYAIPFSSYAYCFLGEYERDPEFAIAESFVQSSIYNMTAEERQDVARKRLNGCCQDLVELDSSSCLEYIHRSLVEYLEAPDAKERMDCLLGGFNGVDAISQLIVADFRLGKIWTDSGTTMGWGSDARSRFLRMRRENGIDHPPYLFLSYLEQMADTNLWRSLNNTDFYLQIYHTLLICTNGPGEALNLNKESSLGLTSPLHILTMEREYAYPLWKIAHDQTVTDSTTKVILLVYCDLNSREKPGDDTYAVTRVLLERGLLDLNSETHLLPVWWRCLPGQKKPKISVWHTCLIVMFLQSSSLSRASLPRMNMDYSRFLELCLRYKPDLNFSFSFPGGDNHVALIRSGRDHKSIELDLYSWEGGFEFPSLRLWIEASQLENKDLLLQLYDSQVEKTRDVETQSTDMSPPNMVTSESESQHTDELSGLIIPDLADTQQVGITKQDEIPIETQPSLTLPKSLEACNLALAQSSDRRSSLVQSGVNILYLTLGIIVTALTAVAWSWLSNQ